MTHESRGEELLLSLDPDLNIFALANSMDLLRDHDAPPDRVLTWFRDGFERRIHLRPAEAGGVDMEVAMEGRRDGQEARRREPFETGLLREAVRPALVRAIEAANELSP